jgi:calcineurin-like phosphoesterase family protein
MGRPVSAGLWWLVPTLAVTYACGQSNGNGSGGPPVIGPDPPETPVTAVLVGAGDIGQCDNDGGRPSEATARLLDGIEGTVFTAGDNAYPTGSAADFANCYDKSWGRHKRRTRPSPGNHEYDSPGAAPYFNYFGANAGDFGLGYYSYNLGRWHIVSLNSNAPLAAGQEQYVWLQDDLTFNRPACTLVYFHHPRFTSGPSNGGFFRDVWQLMFSLGVDVVVNGHDHGYERFAPQTPEGIASPTGIREFVAGTGGASLYAQGARANSEVRVSTYGVLKLTLRNRDYEWDFIEAPSGRVRDHDIGVCH